MNRAKTDNCALLAIIKRMELSAVNQEPWDGKEDRDLNSQFRSRRRRDEIIAQNYRFICNHLPLSDILFPWTDRPKPPTATAELFWFYLRSILPVQNDHRDHHWGIFRNALCSKQRNPFHIWHRIEELLVEKRYQRTRISEIDPTSRRMTAKIR